MIFLTFFYEGKIKPDFLAIFGLIFLSTTVLWAQPETNSEIPEPGAMAQKANAFPKPISPTALVAVTNAVPVTPSPVGNPSATPTPSDASAPMPLPPSISEPSAAESVLKLQPNWSAAVPILGAVMSLGSIAGFILYYCGLTRAKNSGHTTTLLLVGALVGLLGFWVGGFALQSGGIGDARAALMQAPDHATASALDHELGFPAFGHHWGIMGSSGFFLATDDASRNSVALLFLTQAAMALIAVTAALGAALERGRLLAMAFCAYIIGWLIYPLFANWTWGGGWLAETGRELHLGNGFVDPGGAGVVHQTAGTLALVLAIALGPRHGRFGRGHPSRPIPGHNVPFLWLGGVTLLLSWMAANGFIFGSLPVDPSQLPPPSCAGLAVINTLLAALGGLIATFVQTAVQKNKPEPPRLCRGLLGGAVASCGCAGLVDPWAAFLIGCLAGLLVQFVLEQMERRHIDDPAGAAAVHGAAGAWGVIATGLFANGSGGFGLNGVPQTVRGFFFGGGLHQLGAQVIGALVGFALVYLLSYLGVSLVQKIFGNRANLTVEGRGLDWDETGALGYQGDTEPEE
jgi:Amt family ammonium transporter